MFPHSVNTMSCAANPTFVRSRFIVITNNLLIIFQLIKYRVGTNVVNIINNYVGEKSESGTPVVSLKWPNDVLINGEKVSGVLIEMEKEHLVIGIGCNIGSAPVVVGTGPNGARQATYLYQHCRKSDLATSDNVADLIESLRRDVGADIVKSFSDMLQQNDASSMSPCAKEAHGRNIVDRANQYMDKELQYLRLDHQASGQSVAGTKVVPLHINVDGTFQVSFSEFIKVSLRVEIDG